MKTKVVVLLAISCGGGAIRAQSVAQTLVTLTNSTTALGNRVATLEGRPAGGGGTGSPLVEATSQTAGGQLRVLGGQKQEAVRIFADGDGGNFYLKNAANGLVAALVPSSDGVGDLFLYNKTGGLRQVTVGIGANHITGGVWIYDQTGNKELAHFGTTADGTAGYVEVNGVRVHDYAEVFEISDCAGLTPGSVVAASSDGDGIQLSGQAYDPAAVGVISGAGTFEPGMRIGSREDGSSDLPVAVSGQVYVRVSSEAGAIRVGDLLVSSSIPGVAMRGADPNKLTGTVIGKALQPYAGEGESLIRMLVLNR
jgi:hypothetical protein